MRKITIEIDGLPKIITNANSNWRARWAQAKLWKRIVYNHLVLNRLIPKTPIRKAKLTCIRYAFGRVPDFENLASSFKHVIDCLVESKIIIDDNQSVIGQPTYIHVPAKPKQGKIRIEIEEI